MKKTFFWRRNAFFDSASLPVGAIILVVVVFIAGVRLLFPDVFMLAAAPALRAGAALSALAADTRALFGDADLLRRERDGLRQENITLTNENLALMAKVSDLTELLGQSPSTPGIIAGVLARPPATPYDTIVLAIGTTAGVSVGMRAFAPGSVPIGTVESTTASSARVSLYSSPGATLAAWVGESRIPITLTGAGGGTFAASAPKDSGILKGDIVYAAAGGAYPIGEVTKFDTELASPGGAVHIQPLINLYSLVWVKLVP